MARLAHLLALASVAATLAAAQGNTTAIAVTTTTAPNGPANATARCAWSQLAGEPCATNRGCVNNPDLKLCFDASCFDLTTVDACRARDGCVWNGTRCKDYNLNFGIPDNFYCAAVKDARVCNQISNCAWAGATSVCLSRPGFQPPAPLNPNCTAATIDACDRAKGCVFIANRCFYPRCRVQKNATQCGRFSGSCVWVNDVQQCVDVSFSQAPDDCPSWRHPATCIATRRCGWTRDQCVLGLNKEANRVGGCAFVANPQGCNASNGCVFEAQINRCLDPNCPRLETADKCRTVSGCSWYRNECVDNNLAFGTHPCSNITNSDVCRGKCGWSPSTRTCLPLAGTCSMSTVSNCPSGCTADQTTGVCAFSGCPATALNGEECDRSKGCVMTQNGKCFDYNVVYGKYPCERVKSKDLCGGACQWNNGTCIPGGEGTPCSQLRQDDKRFCPERCGYEEKLKMCYERRCGGLSRADCFAQTSYGCAWRNSICLDQNVQFGFYECRLSTSPQLCGGRCAWQNNQCATYTACAFGQQGDPNKCPRPRCSFEPQVGFCVDPACGQQTTAEGCADRQGCAWRDGKCSDYNVALKAYDCARVQNASFCGGRCRYDTASSKCVFDPSKVPCSELRQGDKQQCDSARCTFDEGSRLCYDLNCSLITVAADCAKRQGCSWKGGEKGKCADRNVQYRRYPCNGVQREEACQGQCEWDANQTDVNRRCRPRSWLPTGCTVEMRDAEVQALNACLDPIRAVSRLGANVTLAFIRGEVEKVCGNATCLAALNATKCATQFLAYAKTLCSRRNSSDAYCGVSVLSQQQAQCGGIAPTDPGSPASAEQACNSTEACRFNPRANRCEFRPTQDLLALQCSPCVRQYKDIENLVDQRRGVQLEKDDPMTGFDVMCAKVKGSYCMTRFNVAQFQDFKPRDLAGDMLTKLCADDTSATDQRCFQKVANAVMKRRTAAAQQSMLECSRTTGLTGGPDCSADFQNAMQQQKEFDATVASMCTKTTDGRLCLTLPKALANKSQELQGCYAAVVDRGDACSTSCDTLLKAEIDAWGCCAGTLQRIFGDADIKDRVARELTVAQKQAPPDTQNAQAGGSTEVQRSSRLLLQQSPQGTTGSAGQPQGPGTQSPQGTTGSAGQPQGPGTQSPQGTNGGAGPGTQSPQGTNGGNAGGGNNGGGQNSNGPQQQAPVNKRESGYLANLRMCTSFGENVKNTIGNTCNVTFAPVAQKRRVYLTIAWSALQSDSTLNSAISDAVQEDMQTMMGISSDKVDNFTIGEATGVTVTVTNTTARGLKVLATSSGTYAEVSVKDSSTSATTDATSDYDTEISSQSATLSSTSDALESQCSDSTACVDSSSSSLISYSATQSDITTTAAPTTTTTAGKTSASASLAAQVALAAAAIVALAF